MGKNWAKTGAKVALLTAGLVVIGSGAAYGTTIDAGQVTGVLAPVTGAVQEVTGQGAVVPAPLAKKRLDEPAAVTPLTPQLQSSAIDTAPVFAAMSTAADNVSTHVPGGKAALEGADKAASRVQGAADGVPAPLAKKRSGNPVPGISNRQIVIPPNADDPVSVGTPLDNLDQMGDPAKAVGGAVGAVTGAVTP